jgi:hypothetical protein
VKRPYKTKLKLVAARHVERRTRRVAKRKSLLNKRLPSLRQHQSVVVVSVRCCISTPYNSERCIVLLHLSLGLLCVVPISTILLALCHHRLAKELTGSLWLRGLPSVNQSQSASCMTVGTNTIVGSAYLTNIENIDRW